MAVNVLHINKGINNTNIIEHHRNPSGINNKTSWLLEQSHRDAKILLGLFGKIILADVQSAISWCTACTKALQIINLDLKDVSELNKYLKSNQDKEYLLKLLKENMEFHNKNVAYRTILDKHNLLNEAEEYHKNIMKMIIED